MPHLRERTITCLLLPAYALLGLTVRNSYCIALTTLLGWLAATASGQTNLYVATDGSTPFKSVQAAIMAVPSGSRENPVIIHIAPGIYHELIYIQREKSFFRLIGENPTNTILTFNLYASITNADGKPIGTFKTPSTTIDADDFDAENLTFANAAGPVGQALAIRVDGDRASFRNCHFLGWQDTILLNRGRQYFEECYIAGHVDFIFGAATAWFERCHINCLGTGYVTAASTPESQPYGFVFSHSTVTGNQPGVQAYLGRPWRIYASTIFMNCDLSEVIRANGWFDWNKPEAHQTARYAEYQNTGPGANPSARPNWVKMLTKSAASKITMETVLGGTDNWLPMMNFVSGANRFDVEYSEAGGTKLLLDAHVPMGGGQHPVLIIVHGGGWNGGDKETDIVPVLAPAVTNFTWFTINYRLAPTNRWPASYDDVLTAIRWAKQHASEYQGDPDHMALIGYSAGGQLVTLAGIRTNADTRVQAIVGFAPPTEIAVDAQRRGSLDKWVSMKYLLGRDALDETTLQIMRDISPSEHIQPGLPPFLIVQGNTDQTVLYGQTQDFLARLKAANIPCDLITITNGQHRIADWNQFRPGWNREVALWLQTQLIR
ncbi:MAG TPA: pectinesterase family protein [Verrucomicrobiae bacterium]|jgi:pectinesterase